MAEKLTPVSELVRRLYAEYEYPQVCSHGRDLMMLMDCAGCAEDIITAAVLEARRYELKRAEQHSTPMHANASGNGPDGCPRLCKGCRIERRFRDHFRALSAELEKLA